MGGRRDQGEACGQGGREEDPNAATHLRGSLIGGAGSSIANNHLCAAIMQWIAADEV
jgi:hypothetical protein